MNREEFKESFQAVDWRNDALVLLDQRKLPFDEVYLTCSDIDQSIEAIKNMTVRGAPAIGICAAYACVLSAAARKPVTDACFQMLRDEFARLAQARPTAVNLNWAVSKMLDALTIEKELGFRYERFLRVAQDIHNEDIQNNLYMGQLAAEIFSRHDKQAVSVITHCNAGSLATGGYGTALGAIRAGWRNGLIDHVYADETRPWLQGARLTAWELMKDDIPVTLNADGAAAWLIKDRKVKWVVVGADRIAANGDVANKIGTFSLAIQARFLGARVMVVAPSSTVDLSTVSGEQIDIEMRSMDELRYLNGKQIAVSDLDIVNPVFDVTPADLIDYIITEKGVIENPNTESIARIIGGES